MDKKQFLLDFINWYVRTDCRKINCSHQNEQVEYYLKNIYKENNSEKVDINKN